MAQETQRDALRLLDEAIRGGMEAAGLVSRGDLTPKAGGSPVPVRFYLDQPDTDLSELGNQVVKQVSEVRIFRADVPAPAVGDTIVSDDGTYQLAMKIGQDASLTAWRVRDG